jgi:hypothetical protein
MIGRLRAGLSAMRSFVCALLFLLTLAAAHAQVNVQEQTVFTLLKQRRPNLVLDPLLCKVARARATDLAVRNYFAHVNPDGVAVNFLVRRAGYVLPPDYSTAPSANELESISAGRSTASETLNDLLGDGPHRRQLLGEVAFFAAQTHVGVGFVNRPGSQYQYYWSIITAPPSGPMLSIAAPATNGQVNEPSVEVRGMSGGQPAAAKVQVRVENDLATGPWVPADGTTVWSATVSGLTPGVNTLRIQTLDGNDEVLRQATRDIRYVVLAPVTIGVEGSGTVMAGFAGTTQREVGRTYMVIATPATGSVFLEWTGDQATESRIITFTVPPTGLSLTARFIPNPFVIGRGGYSGLFTGTGDRYGAISLNLLTNGTFTGRLRFESEAVVLRGRFSGAGAAQLNITTRSGLTATLALNYTTVDGLAMITGTILGETWRADLAIEALSKPSLTTPNPYTGRYTLVIPPSESGSPTPPGNGAATLRVNSLGTATLTGTLADGARLAVSGRITVAGTLPVFFAPYAKKGLLTGPLRFRTEEVSDLDGPLYWHRPTGTGIFPQGFSVQTTAVGSRYSALALGQPAVPVTMEENNAALALGDGGFDEPVVQLTTLAPGNKLIFPMPQVVTGLSAKINPITGSFAGRFMHPETNKLTTFRGVILQKQGAGFGFFAGGGEAGYATFAPAEIQASSDAAQ